MWLVVITFPTCIQKESHHMCGVVEEHELMLASWAKNPNVVPTDSLQIEQRELRLTLKKLFEMIPEVT